MRKAIRNTVFRLPTPETETLIPLLYIVDRIRVRCRWFAEHPHLIPLPPQGEEVLRYAIILCSSPFHALSPPSFSPLKPLTIIHCHKLPSIALILISDFEFRIFHLSSFSNLFLISRLFVGPIIIDAALASVATSLRISSAYSSSTLMRCDFNWFLYMRSVKSPR